MDCRSRFEVSREAYTTIVLALWRRRVPRCVWRQGLAPFLFLNEDLTFASCSGSRATVVTLSSRGTRRVVEIERPFTVRCATLSPDGAWLAIVRARGVGLFSRRSKAPPRWVRVPASYFEALAFSNDSRFLAVGTNTGVHVVAVRESITTSLVVGRRILGVTALAFSPKDSALLAIGATNGRVTFAAVPECVEAPRDRDYGVVLPSIAFSPDGDELAVAGIDSGVIVVVDVASADVMRQVNASTGPIYRIVFSPAGTSFAVATKLDGHNAVAILDARTGEIRGKFARSDIFAWRTHSATLSPDGRLLAIEEVRSPDDDADEEEEGSSAASSASSSQSSSTSSSCRVVALFDVDTASLYREIWL